MSRTPYLTRCARISASAPLVSLCQGRQVLSKLFLIVLVFVGAWWILKKYRNSLTREEPPPAGAAEDMVRCAHCGVHLPRSESRASGEKFFCSEEHLRLHR